MNIMQDHLRQIAEMSLTRKYSAGATILYQGEVPRSVHVVLRGAVRVFGISELGEEQIVTYHIGPDMFPVSWIFDKAPSTVFFYEALTDCEIALVDRASFLEHFRQDADASMALADSLATSYAAFLLRINALEQPKARQKLLYTLYYLCERYGVKAGHKTTISLTLTHQQLASLVGLTRETTATQMNQLKREKLLTYSKQTYTVDTVKLLDMIGEDSFRGISIQD
jgi:CRP/FNR family transcriptional regulator